MKLLISYFYNALLEYYHYIKRGVKHKVHQVRYRENKLTVYNSVHSTQCTTSYIVTRHVENVHHWQEHKHASVFAISQLRHRSVTVLSLATHAADTVAAHRYHESESDVMFTSQVK